MVPNGPQGPGGGPQPVNPSLLRGNPGIMAPGGQAGNMSQQSFPSLVSPRTQFGSNMNGIAGMGNAGNINNMGLLGNASSLLNHSFGNGVPAGSSGSGLAAQAMNLQQQQQRGGGGGSGMDMAGSGVLDPLLFASSSGQSQGQQIVQNPGNNMASEHAQQQAQQMEATQSFQQQFSNAQQQQQQQQQQAQQQMRAGMGNVPNIKMEQQLGSSDSNGPSQQQQLQQQYQSLRNLASVKLEPQQLHAMRALGPVKLEPNQNSDPALFLQQQQQQQQQQQHQQQQLLQLSRQNSQAVAQMNLLQQQRLLQLQQQQQQQQQQQLLRQLPPQRSQQQLQQQLQQQALPLRSQVKPAGYEPGVCARRLTKYMYQQQHRPADNNIEFWRKFVSDFFAPHAKKRWCVSLYGSSRQTNGVFPQDVWHCEICSRKPGRGFETTVEVLPRLLKIKYDSGTQEELLYVDMPREYHNASGQIVLDYAKAVQESVFEQLRVVREGQLRIVFSSDLKICSWEFCARRHEELIPRRLIVPQVSQLGAVAQKYQSSTQNATSNSSLSSQDLQSTCNSFVASARHLAKALEVPLVNDLGYTKRYVRCLQISEVVNSMKDLIDYSREMRTGPMESLIHFPRRNSAAGITAQQQQQAQQTEDQVAILQNTSQNDPSSSQPSAMQLGHNGNGSMNTGHAVNAASSSTPSSTIAGLLHQNSMNSRHENNIGNVNDPYGVGNTLQIPPASSPSLLPNSQPNPSSPFPSTTSASNNMNNGPQNSLGTPHLNSTSSPANIPVMQQTVNQINEAHLSDSQSSMHHILQEMMSSQVDNSDPLGNDMKGINGITSTLSGGNSMLGNGVMANRSAMNGISYRGLGGIGPSSATGIRSPIPNAMTLNGRIGMSPMTQDTTLNHQQQQQQQDFGNRLLNPGLATVNSFNNMQFNWKPT